MAGGERVVGLGGEGGVDVDVGLRWRGVRMRPVVRKRGLGEIVMGWLSGEVVAGWGAGFVSFGALA